MNDAKGRPIGVGDCIATLDLHIVEGEVREGAILGKVIEIFAGDDHEEVACIGDGISYEGGEIITLGGYVWVICLDCNSPWVKDVNHDEEVCPFCESSSYVHDRAASPGSVTTCR